MYQIGKYRRPVYLWLCTGLFMIIIQIFVGGVTRLTGSGLSITEWEIVTGTLPPLSQSEWQDYFQAYKDTPQYELINAEMSMKEFKFIFFWEYIHRLWARLMGLVFAIPLVYFLFRQWINKTLGKKLLIVVLLAALVASFGWIMVASGLIERPWVNAYKLTMHLSLALILYGYLFWLVLQYQQGKTKKPSEHGGMKYSKLLWILSIVVFIQIVLGGIMSGMRAALVYPSFPDYNGAWMPEVLLHVENWTGESMINYDSNGFAPGLIQFLHRNMGYLIAILSVILSIGSWKHHREKVWKQAIVLLNVGVVIQIVLGIGTLLYSVGRIPVFWGSFHQLGAIFIFSLVLYMNFMQKISGTNSM